MATMTADEKKWKIEAAANTLIEAEKIKKDKTLLREARAEIKRRLEATQAASKI